MRKIVWIYYFNISNGTARYVNMCGSFQQASSIIGHQRQTPERLVLPTSDEDPPLLKGDTRGAYSDRRIDEMSRLFNTVNEEPIYVRNKKYTWISTYFHNNM